MAREITINTWCDACLATDARIPGIESTVSLDGAPGVTLALCDSHRDQLLQPLVGALTAWGQAAAPVAPRKGTAGAATPTGRQSCPIDGCTGKALPRTLAKHLLQHHGIRAADARTRGLLPSVQAASAPAQRAIQVAGALPVDHALPCPECGRLFAKNQGRAQHLIRFHAMTSKTERDAAMAAADAALEATG